MNGLNERILQAKYKINERKRMQNLVQKLIEEQRELDIRKNNLFENLRDEEIDVKRLEGLSVIALIHAIKGDMNEVLEKEKNEALSAKLKYDGVCFELQNVTNEIKDLESRVSSFGDIDREYLELIAQKESLIKSGALINCIELDNILENQVKYKAREKELKEALTAGQELMDSLGQVKESLDSASGWGTWDMLGGGFIATMAKHNKIDEAKVGIDTAQSLLNRFHRELQDVGGSIDINIEIGSFLTFADYFFDGFFTDWAVQSKISEAQDMVYDTIEKVRAIILKIEKDLDYTHNEIKRLEDDRFSIIERL